MEKGERGMGIRVNGQNELVISKGLQWVLGIALTLLLAGVGIGGKMYWDMSSRVGAIETALTGQLGKEEGRQAYLWDVNRQQEYASSHRATHEAELSALTARLDQQTRTLVDLQAKVDRLAVLVERSQ